MKACYPGTFDPITNGHLDVIERASRMFDELDVLIMRNVRKTTTFTEEERKNMLEKAIATLPDHDNIHVLIGTGLTVEMARKVGAQAIVRGIRAVTDYEYELQQATGNQVLAPEIETLFIIARPEYSFLSSSIVKEIAFYDGDISAFIPDVILDEIHGKLTQKQ
ncbi:MAG: pantetheine-phosphate adenylyltransferase [Solobacterium sp.]|nr:pantetheine-phosphate adenylyltransferase [Solobacterium sp.]MBQ1382330.1 pantetheine-phosphate adenylyltransferase [Solobacterium sp.]MBQ1447466.1 pantetheine-phosphate adenylyltransferase [Solobacterium sp.]MBQ6592254.1 pantetheine-phosphate adenylyltransferase [Solobacterium sp.]MBR0477801.1 pantetheine-phosphate adenylyltransferase [Solobacterium sp.]